MTIEKLMAGPDWRRLARPFTLSVLLGLMAAVASGQFLEPSPEPPRPWLPELMAHPSKLSPDRFVNDEFPSITLDRAGNVWVAWSSSRTQSSETPGDNPDINLWQWPDDGEDMIAVRRFDGKNWSEEMIVSTVNGVNYKPSIVPDGDGVRVLWTARRDGRWAAYERRWSQGRWDEEKRLTGGDDSLEIRAQALADGSILAVLRKLAPPRIELHSQVFREGQWTAPSRLDEGQGRCYRPNLLPLAQGDWMVAWDEERGGNYDIYARRASGPVERLTTSELWDTAPSLAQTSDGAIWAAWGRREPIGGRFTYRGRSIFAKVLRNGAWRWAPSPFSQTDPGRLTRHSMFWASQGISEERYAQLLARSNGDLWLFWLGGGRSTAVSFSGRVFSKGDWSEPRMVFHDPIPYTAFQLPSVRRGVEYRATGRGPYQTPLAAQVALALSDREGRLWLAYEVPRMRHMTDRFWATGYLQRPAGYGADIYCHQVDLDERTARLPSIVDEQSPLPPLKPRPYWPESDRPALTVGGKEYQLVWGDMHGHTENDGIGTFDMYYAHGLFVTGMDFLASANHDYTPDYLTKSEWAEIQALAGVFNQVPNRVAFSGWEWTATNEQGGHRAMYFLNDDGPIYRHTTLASNTIWKLFNLLRGWDVILQPHHPNWTGYDPELQPVYEITSGWRQQREESREFDDGPVNSAWEALERGYRIGFVGSGDSHWMGPGEDYGITGAYVENLTREDVFEAIRAKRVFASTGARMLIDFRVNGSFMGGQTQAGSPVKVEVAVEGDADLERVEIVKDHHVIHAARGEGRAARFSFVDQSRPPADKKASYYYLRVKQQDKMYAWTSPVWVDWAGR